jgi:hypothetical protein
MITSVAVLIALIGFTAVLCLLPCNGDCCHGERDGKCEMRDGKCPYEKGECSMGEGKCEEGHEGCGMEQGKCSGGHEGCSMHKGCGMEGMENGKCEMKGMEDGKCMMHSDGSCNMEMGNHGCCCCCCMMMNMKGCHMDNDSAKTDSAHVKVRGKL